MSGNRGIPARVFHFLNLLNLTGLILAIIGGTQMSGSHSANSSQGHPLTRAAIILFVAVFAILSAITIMRFLPQMRNVLPGEKHILLAVALSIPFFTVRLIYSILTSFGTNPTLFNPITGNVVVQSFMAVLEEFIIVGLYIAAGLLAPGFEQNKVQPWGPIGQAGEGMAGSGQQTTRYDHQSGPHTATNHRWDPEAGIEQPVPSFIPSIAPSAGHAIRS